LKRNTIFKEIVWWLSHEKEMGYERMIRYNGEDLLAVFKTVGCFMDFYLSSSEVLQKGCPFVAKWQPDWIIFNRLFQDIQDTRTESIGKLSDKYVLFSEMANVRVTKVSKVSIILGHTFKQVYLKVANSQWQFSRRFSH
jgi:hypothetical protein